MVLYTAGQRQYNEYAYTFNLLEYLGSLPIVEYFIVKLTISLKISEHLCFINQFEYYSIQSFSQNQVFVADEILNIGYFFLF